jgi:ribosomal-protein-alanine N-acetyltransferase
MRLDRTSLWTSNSVELFLLEPEDVSLSYVSWLNDPMVNCYLESRFVHHTVESTRVFVQQCLVHSETLFLGIRYFPSGSKHVGNIKLLINQHHKTAEVGLLIGERNIWGRGVASSAIQMIINISKYELGLRRLTAGCYASNIGSQRAFEKAGFNVECQRKKHVLINGKPEDIVLMGYFIY